MFSKSPNCIKNTQNLKNITELWDNVFPFVLRGQFNYKGSVKAQASTLFMAKGWLIGCMQKNNKKFLYVTADISVISVVYTLFTNVAAGCTIQPGKPQVGNPCVKILNVLPVLLSPPLLALRVNVEQPDPAPVMLDATCLDVSEAVFLDGDDLQVEILFLSLEKC